MIRPEVINHTSDLITLAPFLLAFTFGIRKLIGKRDKWACQDEGCDKSFQKGDMVHASHWNHDKSSPTYDTVEAGRIQCIDHHQAYHEWAVGQEEVIQITPQANKAAILFLRKTNRKTTKKGSV